MGSTRNIPLNLDPELYSDGYKDPFIQDEDKLTISQLIPRILVERGSFLNITEASLREEIQNQPYIEQSKTSSPDAEGATNNDNNSPTEEASTEVDDPSEVFQKQKADLSRNISTALNEISLSLDFVSLLISSVKPNLAKTTISPHLSKNVPLGSLNASRLSTSGEDGNPEKSSDSVKLSTKIGEGWKNESLNKITTLFQKSSKDLGEQVAKERTYWNMINKVRNNDEILFRTRDPANGSRAIGIKYGYGDSGSNFHDKGLAILRKDNLTGEITFNPLVSSGNRIQTKVFKFIRVKILSEIDGDFMLTGQSVFDPKKIGSRNPSTNDGGILEDIEKARFFLFEEDLFYQLLREAKQLINYNVSIISNKVIIEINNEIIEIESVIYDENNEDDLTNNYQNINDFSSMNNQKCQLILNYLKLMLCCYYQYNLNLKQKIPTAFTKRKQLNSHPLILRPMVGNIRYELNIKIANEILTRLVAKYNSKLDITYDLKKYVNLEASPPSNPFQKATERPVSTVSVVLKNKTNDSVMKIHIELTTNEIFMNLILNLNIIKFSTIDDLEKNLNGLNILQMSYNDFNDFEECLDWSILRFTS